MIEYDYVLDIRVNSNPATFGDVDYDDDDKDDHEDDDCDKSWDDNN